MPLIAHLSDPHLGPTPPVRLSELISKRAFGYLNWKRNRGLIYDNAVVDALVADIRAQGADHIVVTGDIINLGLPAEFDEARDWLLSLGSPQDVSVVPGNHDAYVPGAFEALNQTWRDFMAGDNPGDADFPFVRRRGALVLIGVSTAVATLPIMATGTVGEEQTIALERALADSDREGLFRIVLIHHPPVAGSTRWHRRLTDAGRFRDVIARHGAELILHGHNHRMSIASLDGPDGPVPVVGASAASMRPGEGRTGGSYNLIRVEGTPGAYAAVLSERRFMSGGSVETVITRRLLG